jgi:hypothetical protein
LIRGYENKRRVDGGGELGHCGDVKGVQARTGSLNQRRRLAPTQMSVFLVVQLLHSGLISNGFLPIYGTAINSVMSPNNIAEADDRCFAQAKDSCIATRNFMGYVGIRGKVAFLAFGFPVEAKQDSFTAGSPSPRPSPSSPP